MTSKLSYLVRALFWVALVRMLLCTHSMKFVVRAFTTRVAHREPQSVESLAKTVWAVRKVSTLVPFASCLTQALTAQILLVRCQCPSTLHIGVKKGGDGNLAAHAWLESDGRLLLGGTRAELGNFTHLASYSTVGE